MKVIKRQPHKGYLDCWLWVPKQFVDMDGTKRALTYEVNDYNGRTKWLYLWQETADHLLLPRAFWDPSTLPFQVVDCRPTKFTKFNIRSRIKLDHLPQDVNGIIQLMPTHRVVQKNAFKALSDSYGGVLQLACGKGKTIVALKLIATEGTPALICLDNTNLLSQWKDDIEEFLDVPGGVGFIMAGKKQWKKAIVLATYQSIANWSATMPEEVRRWFSKIIFDEGHHVSAPTYAKGAPLIYGNRFSLTATPERDDGFHIISDLHLGKVLYKDLSPELRPTIAFYWTGLEPDMRDPNVAARVLDINQEVHVSKLAGYFGQWNPRLQLIIETCVEAITKHRRVLVLSNSVDEVINLMVIWTRGWPELTNGGMYTDIPIPTPQDVGETLTPADLPTKDLKKIVKAQLRLTSQLKKATSTGDQQLIQAELDQVQQTLKQFAVHKKIKNLMEKRQKAFIKQLVSECSSAGMLTYGVPPATRQQFLNSCPLNFAVTKYGKEGLDCQALDTVVLSSLFSSKNGLQQVMGRPTRPMPGKKSPLIVALVDNVGQCLGMSKKLQGHLRSWPREEGGPYDFILVNYPVAWTNRKTTETIQDLLGR